MILSPLVLSLAGWVVAGDGSPDRRAQYRGPIEEVLIAFPGPSPALPGFPTEINLATVDLGGALEGYNRWEFWFETQKDVLLRSRDFRRRELLVPPAAIPAGTPDDGRVRSQDARGPLSLTLLKAVQAGDDSVVRLAAYGLGRIGDKDAVETLEKLTKKPPLATQQIAALSLGLIEDRSVLSALANLIVDSQTHADVKAAAILAVGLHGKRQGVSLLRDYVEKNLTPEAVGGAESSALSAAIVALGLCRDRDTAPLLIARYRELREFKVNRTKGIELLVLQALGRIGDASAQIVLLEALAEKDEQRRRAAALALGDLGDRTAVKPLIVALEDDSDVQTRGFAAISLGRLGGEAARDALRAAFGVKGSRTVKTFAALGLGLLGDRGFSMEILKALQQPSEESMRGAFAIALGLLNEPKALDTLFQIAEARSSNHRLRGYAAIAIGLIRPEDGLPRLLKVLEEDPDKVDLFRRALCLAVGLFGSPKAGPALTKILVNDTRPIVREHAALGLNLCRPRSEIEALTKILEGEKYRGDLALYCVAALAGMGDRFEFPAVSETFFNLNYRYRTMLTEDLMWIP